MLKKPAVKAAYEAQAEQLALLEELLRARQRAGLSQAEVAARDGHPDACRCPVGGRWWGQAAFPVSHHLT
jgi:hypothetical protein